mmetsp:Transcript_73978/g.208552  ORF Transcript_73978/g.208552 Transcript_73978/m.208552 type:complete len:134 (+) Transcript_73978:2-403(+)
MRQMQMQQMQQMQHVQGQQPMQQVQHQMPPSPSGGQQQMSPSSMQAMAPSSPQGSALLERAASGEVPSEGLPQDVTSPLPPSSDYTLTRPHIVPILDPKTGKSVNTIGMNFEPRKERNPLKIINPLTRQEVLP